MINLPSLWDMVVEKYRLEITLAVIALTLVGVGVFWLKKPVPVEQVKILSVSDEASISSKPFVYVDVSGAVQTPGVYKLEPEMRIDDALRVAGGLNQFADTKWIEVNLNRAERIKDGMKVYIPEINEAKNGQSAENIITANDKININLASSVQLEELSGVGPATAKKIIDNRPYSDLNQLLERKVLGQKIFDQLKDQLSVW